MKDENGGEVCVNGHLVPAGNAFCGQCGLPVAQTSGLLGLDDDQMSRMCANGHPVAPDATGCEVCGAAVMPVSKSKEQVPLHQRGPSVGRKARRPVSSGRLIAIGGAALVLVIACVVAFTVTRSSDSANAGARVGNSSSVSAAHQVCVNQLTRIVDRMGNHGDVSDGYLNGMSDPFYIEGDKIFGWALQDISKGKPKAEWQAEIVRTAESWCTSQGDPRRNGVDDQGDPL